MRDSDQTGLGPLDMIRMLLEDNRELLIFLRAAHVLCHQHRDVATASLIENWIDQTERRTWFLAMTVREM